MNGKSRQRKKTIYLDVIILDVQDFAVLEAKTNEYKIFKKTYCKVATSTQEMNTTMSKNHFPPIWNSDFTFMMKDANEELLIELYQKKNQNIMRFLGQVNIQLKDYEFQQLHDLFADIQPPPSCEAGKFIVAGKLHFTFFKSYNSKKMPLSHYGKPTWDLPVRIDVGDIILCSSRNILTTTVHLSTRSQWDHVAMVVKKRDNDQLRLFEATMDGVETYLLSTALKYYREHCRVAVRRVLLEKNDQFLEELYTFVEEVLGRPYKQDWIQLVRAAYNANESDDLTSVFCSQLIAAAYQRLDIIAKDIPSNNFVPSDFANDLQGQLVGARIDQLRKVPSISKTEITQKADIPADCRVIFEMKDVDYINNVKIPETASKRDQKYQTYTVYIMNVTTEGGMKWILFKRFHDFVEFDKEIRKYFDGIPKLQKKVNSSIQFRRNALQKYIKFLVNSPAIRCSLLVDFLTVGRRGVVIEPREEITAPKLIKKDKPKRLVKSNTTTPEHSDFGDKKKKKKKIGLSSPDTRRRNDVELNNTPIGNEITENQWMKVTKPTISDNQRYTPDILRRDRTSLRNSQSDSSLVGAFESISNPPSNQNRFVFEKYKSFQKADPNSAITHQRVKYLSACEGIGDNKRPLRASTDKGNINNDNNNNININNLEKSNNVNNILNFIARHNKKNDDIDEKRKSDLYYTRKFGKTILILDEEGDDEDEEEVGDIEDEKNEIYFSDAEDVDDADFEIVM